MDATTVVTAATAKHPCAVSPRFRAGAFGWRCEPAVTCIKAAVSEILAVTTENPSRGAEGATFFFLKRSPMLRNIRSPQRYLHAGE
jgi:hypothetical protein